MARAQAGVTSPQTGSSLQGNSDLSILVDSPPWRLSWRRKSTPSVISKISPVRLTRAGTPRRPATWPLTHSKINYNKTHSVVCSRIAGDSRISMEFSDGGLLGTSTWDSDRCLNRDQFSNDQSHPVTKPILSLTMLMTLPSKVSNPLFHGSEQLDPMKRDQAPLLGTKLWVYR
jgi:hypothetical protein